MSTPEGVVKKRVSALLKKFDVHYDMPVPTGFGKSGLDYTCCIEGRYFVVETKAENKQPTPRQALYIESVKKRGGRTFLVNEVGGLDDLEIWLKWVTEGK